MRDSISHDFEIQEDSERFLESLRDGERILEEIRSQVGEKGNSSDPEILIERFCGILNDGQFHRSYREEVEKSLSHLGALIHLAVELDPGILGAFAPAIPLLEHSGNPAVRESAALVYVGERIFPILEKNGIALHDYIYSWIRNAPGNLQNIYDRVQRHVQTIESLEKKEPGIVNVLFTQFHLKHLARYPEELLLRQYYERTKDEPYGMALYARDDEENAFIGTGTALKSLRETLPNDRLFRIVEAEDKVEVARVLKELSRRYPANQISFAIVAGHSTGKSVWFGPEDIGYRGNFHQEDIEDVRFESTRKYFEKDPTIILISCRTGLAGNLGESLASALHARVIAPVSNTNIQTIKASESETGELLFDVAYKDGKTPAIFSGIEKSEAA